MEGVRVFCRAHYAMNWPLELALAILRFGLLGAFFYQLACGRNYLRYRDLGAAAALRRSDWAFVIGTPLVVCAVGLAWYWLLLTILTSITLSVVEINRRRAAHWAVEPASREIAKRIRALVRRKARRPQVLVATYKDANDLLEGIDSFTKPVVVIPAQFAAEAFAIEVIALAARQLAPIAGQWRMVLASVPVVCGVALLAIPAASVQPVMYVSAALALCALSLILQYYALRHMDISLDRSAITITGDPDAYTRAIQRAARSVPMVSRFPWWFKPMPISARIAAIVGAFHLTPDASVSSGLRSN
jgi:hypothetical protein